MRRQRARAGRCWLAVALLGAAMAARADQVVIALRPEALLAGPRVTLADVAEVDAADPAVRRAFAAVALGPAPMAGYLERRSRAELDMALRGQALASGHAIVWRGADSVKLRSQTQQWEPGALLALAREQLRQAFGGAGV
ncbi:MAG TPA: hypothetical protein VF616_09885, partial [Duganella sp.]|uniref:hypothetical protein n=1 Tax=Duganella sp. TaxID=1904440 RepID=UPI002ED68C07